MSANHVVTHAATLIRVAVEMLATEMTDEAARGGLTSSRADKDQLNHWEVTGSSPGPSIISGFLSKLFIKHARFDTKTP